MKEIHRRFEGTILVSGDSITDVVKALSTLAIKIDNGDGLNYAEHSPKFSYSYCIQEDPEMTAEQYQKDLGEIIPE